MSTIGLLQISLIFEHLLNSLDSNTWGVSNFESHEHTVYCAFTRNDMNFLELRAKQDILNDRRTFRSHQFIWVNRGHRSNSPLVTWTDQLKLADKNRKGFLDRCFLYGHSQLGEKLSRDDKHLFCGTESSNRPENFSVRYSSIVLTLGEWIGSMPKKPPLSITDPKKRECKLLTMAILQLSKYNCYRSMMHVVNGVLVPRKPRLSSSLPSNRLDTVRNFSIHRNNEANKMKYFVLKSLPWKMNQMARISASKNNLMAEFIWKVMGFCYDVSTPVVLFCY